MLTFCEHGPHHFREKNNRSWKLGDEVVEESNECTNLGIVKNYVGSFQSDVDEAIEKSRKKAGMILNGCTDRKNTNPLIYIYRIMEAGLFTNTIVWLRTLDSKANIILELERCQSWFLRKVFHLPKFCDNAILTKISGLWSESAVNYRKLLFIAHAINRSSEDNVHKLLLLRIRSFLKQPDDSIGLVKDLAAVFKKYDLYDLF